MKTIERLIPLGLVLILGAEQHFYGGAWLTLIAPGQPNDSVFTIQFADANGLIVNRLHG